MSESPYRETMTSRRWPPRSSSLVAGIAALLTCAGCERASNETAGGVGTGSPVASCDPAISDSARGVAAGTGRAGSSRAAVLLDGDLEEWTDAPTVVDDPADADDAVIDLRRVQALDDPCWLYLGLVVSRAVNAQSMRGTLHLLVDADPDGPEGGPWYGMAGVDMDIELSHVVGASSDQGAGFAVRRVGPSGPGEAVDPYPLGIVVMPTWSVSRFEMRISRGGSPERGLPALSSEVGLKLAYELDGEVEDDTEPTRYAFRTHAGSGPVPTAEEQRAHLTREAGTVRVAQWNVSDGSFATAAPSFAKLLAALEPDVLLLDELPGRVTERDLVDFFDQAPLAALGSWSFALGATGGRQRSVVATRNLPLRPARALASVPYPPGSLDELAARVPESFRNALDLEGERGVSVAGAWIAIDGTEVLFTVHDLQSAGWDGSPQDQLRVLQAGTIRDRIDEERPGGAAPVVIAGDFNLVGSAGPLERLGMHLDGADGLRPAPAVRLGEQTFATWEGPGQSFGPGRLDFILYPGSSIDVVDSFVFSTEDLRPDVLRELALPRTLSSELSDHMIVVADMRVR